MICSPIAGTKLRRGLETSAPIRGDGLHYRLCRADLATQAFRYQIVSFSSVQANAGSKTPVQRRNNVRRPLPGPTVSLSAESDLREEGRDVTRKGLRLLCRSKVPAARHRGPPTNVVKPLHP